MLENEITTSMAEDDDVLFPDGWNENDDIFDEAKWTGTEQTDAPAEEPGQEAEEATEEQNPAPTTEQAETTGEEAPAGEAPTTEQTREMSNKLKFKARVDREDRDVELDESELPTIYQKAQATDRYQAKLAKQDARLDRAEQLAKTLGFDGLDSMLSSAEKTWRDNEVSRLVGEGVHEEVARDMVARRTQSQTPVATPTEEVQSTQPQRDFRTEIQQLLEARPDLRGKQLPDEVVKACASQGQNLLAAYSAYEVRQERAAADKLRKENEVLRQNAASAAKAPVSGTQGGGATDVKPEDDFLRGFDDGY